MATDKTFREFGKYVLLNIFAQFAFSCYTLMDTFFVAWRLRADGLSALNIAFPMFCVINGIGLMIGIGGGIKYSIYKSKELNDDANTIFTNAIVFGLFVAFLFVVSGILFSGYLVRFLGADDSIFEMTNTYLRVMMLFAPAFFMNNILQCFVRNDRNPKLSMAAMVIGSVSNIVLDYVFIFPMNMGIFGAIFATGLAPIISMMVIFPYIIAGNNGFHLNGKIFDAKSIAEISSKGMFALLTELTSATVMFVFNMIILSLAGNLAVAAFSIITVISLVVTAIYTGLSQGIQPIISYNYGKGDWGNVRKILKYAVVTQILLSILIYLTIFCNADSFAAIYNKQNDVVLQSFAVSGMKIYFAACFFIGFNIVISTFFTSTEKSLYSQVISLARGFVVIIPVALILSRVFKMTGVWSAYPVSECVVFVMAIFMLFLDKNHGE